MAMLSQEPQPQPLPTKPQPSSRAPETWSYWSVEDKRLDILGKKGDIYRSSQADRESAYHAESTQKPPLKAGAYVDVREKSKYGIGTKRTKCKKVSFRMALSQADC